MTEFERGQVESLIRGMTDEELVIAGKILMDELVRRSDKK